MDIWFENERITLYKLHDKYLNRTVLIRNIICSDDETALYENLEGKRIEGILSVYRVEKSNSEISIITEIPDGHLLTETDNISSGYIEKWKKRLIKKNIAVVTDRNSIWVTDEGNLIFLEYRVILNTKNKNKKETIPYFLLIPSTIMIVIGSALLINSSGNKPLKVVSDNNSEIGEIEEPITESETTKTETESETAETETESETAETETESETAETEAESETAETETESETAETEAESETAETETESEAAETEAESETAAPIPVIIEGKCGDDVYYSLNLDTGIVEITGNGPTYDMDMLHDDYSGSIFINKSYLGNYGPYIKQVIISGNITRIGDYFFEEFGYGMENYDCECLEIPDTVEEIGKYAFSKCLLSNINFPSKLKKIGEYAFDQCYILREFVFGEELEIIGEYAFWGCQNVTKIDFKSTKITEVNHEMFSNCYSLEDIYFPKSIKKIDGINEISSGYCIYDDNGNIIGEHSAKPRFHIWKNSVVENNLSNEVIYYE